MGPKPTLAVCIIARNEEEFLPRALASVKSVADEIIVVDTGSTDATRAMALQYGARVYEQAWCDDFSHARNHAIDQVQSDWVLCLDADETLHAGQRRVLRRLLESPEDAWFVQIRSPLAGSRAGQVFTHYFERLFRCQPGVRFSGRVHEQIGPALQQAGARVGTSQLILDHAGYALDHERRHLKLRRNLHLLMLDLSDTESLGYVHFQLGETYSLLHEAHSAMRHYQQALACEDLTPDYRVATHQNLSSAAQRVGQYDMAIDHASRALQLEPAAESARLVRAAAHMKAGDLEAAIVDLDEYLHACRDKRVTPRSFGIDADPLRALRIRGECHLRAGRLEEAGADARQIVKKRPGWAGGYRLHGRVQWQAGDLQAAVATLRRALDIDPLSETTWIDVVQLHLARHDRDAARAVLEEAGRHVRSAELYRLRGQLDLMEGRLDDALQDYQRVLDLSPQDPEALRRVTGLYQKLGRTQQAQDTLQRMSKIT